MQSANRPVADEATTLLLNDESLQALRRDMLRFATLQLRDAATAEDVVQEALAAAVASIDRYAQRAAFKTWAFSILKNKIVDVMRDRWNRLRVDVPADENGDESDFDVLFTERQHWQPSERPSSWGDPESTLENQQFWQIFEICMNNLPAATARVFTMRELLGLETDEICKELNISSSNCWVILHRARMSLRLCLQKNWFEKEDAA